MEVNLLMPLHLINNTAFVFPVTSNSLTCWIAFCQKSPPVYTIILYSIQYMQIFPLLLIPHPQIHTSFPFVLVLTSISKFQTSCILQYLLLILCLSLLSFLLLTCQIMLISFSANAKCLNFITVGASLKFAVQFDPSSWLYFCYLHK